MSARLCIGGSLVVSLVGALVSPPALAETIVSCLPVVGCSSNWCLNKPEHDALLESPECQANLRKSCTQLPGCSGFWCILTKERGLPQGESPSCWREIQKPCENINSCTPIWCQRPRLQLKFERHTATGAHYFIIREWSIPGESFTCLSDILALEQARRHAGTTSNQP